MRTSDAHETPFWALAILFWRKILAVERRGIPRTRSGQGNWVGMPMK